MTDWWQRTGGCVLVDDDEGSGLKIMDCPSPAFRSPFLRPWMTQSGAAAAGGGGNMGLKGIIAGSRPMLLFLNYYTYISCSVCVGVCVLGMCSGVSDADTALFSFKWHKSINTFSCLYLFSYRTVALTIGLPGS